MVINALVKGGAIVWSLFKFIKLILLALSTFEDFKITRVKQSGNQVADTLSKAIASSLTLNGLEIFEDFRGICN